MNQGFFAAIAAFLFFLPGSVFAQNSCTNVGRDEILSEASLAKPGYLSSVVDTTFGTSIKRITEDPGDTFPVTWSDLKVLGNFGTTITGHWSHRNRVDYSSNRAWNNDGTFLQIRSLKAFSPGPLGGQFILDGSNFSPVYLARHPTTEFRWSPNPATPNVQYGLYWGIPGVEGESSPDVISKWDVTQAVAPTHIITPYDKEDPGKATVAHVDGKDYVALLGKDKTDPSSTDIYAYVVDLSNPADPIVASRIVSGNDCGAPDPANDCPGVNTKTLRFSPDGKHLIFSYSSVSDAYRILDVDYVNGLLTDHVPPDLRPSCPGCPGGDNTKGQFGFKWGHPVFGYGRDKSDVYVLGNAPSYVFGLAGTPIATPNSGAGKVGRLLAYNVKTKAYRSLSNPDSDSGTNDEAIVFYVNGTNHDAPGYVFAAYDKDAPKYNGELVAFNVDDPSNTVSGVVRLAHLRYYTNCDSCVPHLGTSPDGKTLVWSSAWVSVDDTTTSVYAIDLETKLPPIHTPNLQVVSLSSTSIRWTWSDVPYAARYRVFDDANPGVQIATPTAGSYTYTGLTANTSYSLTIQGAMDCGDGPSAQLTGRTFAAVPTNLTAGAPTTTSIDISWQSNTNPSGTYYEIYRASQGWSFVFHASGTYTNFTDSDLTPATSYHYQVRALNDDSIATDFSSAASTSTLAAPPTDLGASNPTQTTIDLAWSANGNPTGTFYELYRAVDGATFVFVASGTPTAYTDTDLSPSTTYEYRVRALNVYEVPSAYSGTVSSSTLPAPPTAPVVGNPTQTTLDLAWGANGNPAGTIYELYRTADGANFVFVASGAPTAHTDTSLTPATTYEYRVRALNIYGTPSAYSATGSSSTLAAPPASLVASNPTQTTIDLAWNANGNPAGTFFELYRSVDDVVFVFVASDAFTGYTDSGLSAKTSYYYKVRAVNFYGIPTSFSNTDVLETLPTPPGAPGKPSGAAQTTSSILWTWGAPAGATSYKIYPASAPASLSGTSGTNQFTATGLPVNSSHSVIVVASNAGGDSAASPASDPVYTFANLPASVAVSDVEQTSVTIAWSANGNPAGTKVEVERSTEAASGFEVVLSSEDVVSLIDTGLLVCTTYYWRVRYFNGDDIATAYAAIVSTRTKQRPPKPASNFQASSSSNSRIALTWSPSPSEGVAAYHIFYDNATGTIDYNTPYAVVSDSVTAFITPALTTNASYKFGLRAFHRCGVLESNTWVVASATALTAPSGVRGRIVVPKSGKKIAGNRVLVKGEIVQNDGGPAVTSNDVRRFRFQYRQLPAGAWSDIVAAVANHPNPDTSAPYFAHWDVTALADGNYEIRVIARDLDDNDDPNPATITVAIDAAEPDTSETNVGGAIRKTAKVDNGGANSVGSSDSSSSQATDIVLPAGALNDTETQIVVMNNPPTAPAENEGLLPAVGTVEINLANGQSDLAGGNNATIVVSYSDGDQNGIVDGTTIREDELRGYYFDTAANSWKELPSSVNADDNTLTITTTHFTFFGLFATAAQADLSSARVYPVPFRPNSGNADDGVDFDSGNANSGIIFDNLPATVNIKIFNITGQKVDEFEDSNGSGKLQWDVRNSAGDSVASGGYFAVITSPGEKAVVKRIFIVR